MYQVQKIYNYGDRKGAKVTEYCPNPYRGHMITTKSDLRRSFYGPEKSGV